MVDSTEFPCGPGHFCSGGAASPLPINETFGGGECDAGYVCSGGSDVPRPRIDGLGGGNGYICPPGHFCPEGTTNEIGCPAGTYFSATGAVECLPCPLGRTCPGNTTTPEPCPMRHYWYVNSTWSLSASVTSAPRKHVCVALKSHRNTLSYCCISVPQSWRQHSRHGLSSWYHRQRDKPSVSGPVRQLYYSTSYLYSP